MGLGLTTTLLGTISHRLDVEHDTCIKSDFSFSPATSQQFMLYDCKAHSSMFSQKG